MKQLRIYPRRVFSIWTFCLWLCLLRLSTAGSVDDRRKANECRPGEPSSKGDDAASQTKTADIPRIDGSYIQRIFGDNDNHVTQEDTKRLISQATHLLQTYGAVVVENLVHGSVMDEMVAELAQHPEGTFRGSQGSFAGAQTVRNAAKCLGESTVAQGLAVHPVTVGVVRQILQPYTKRVVLGTSSVLTVVGPTSPDEAPAPPQEIHRDDSMWNGDWITNMACTNPQNVQTDDTTAQFPHLSVSVMWAASDFTAINGATRVALFSHTICPRTVEPPVDATYVPAVMRQGSVLLWLGGTLHGAGAPPPYSPQHRPRQGLLFIYNWGMLRSEHNFFNALPHHIIMDFDEELLDLLGYYGQNAVQHPWYIGPVYSQPYLGGPKEGNASYAVEPDSLWDS